jgi:hypothetical protein
MTRTETLELQHPHQVGIMAVQGALAAHGQACHDRSSALRAMIVAPDADLDALAAEIKTGWPG